MRDERVIDPSELFTRNSHEVSDEGALAAFEEALTSKFEAEAVERAREAVHAFIDKAITLEKITKEGVKDVLTAMKEDVRQSLMAHIEEHEAKGEESCITREGVDELLSKEEDNVYQ